MRFHSIGRWVGRQSRIAFGAVVGVAVGSVGSAIAFASIPDAGGVIHGCYDNKGTLRVIDTGAGQS